MTKTTLIEYGTSVIAGSHGDEEIIPALGDGAAVPGHLVSILSTNKVDGAHEGTTDLMIGIVLESDVTGLETAIPDGDPLDIVIPISGHRYNVRQLDTVDALEIGGALDISATPGCLDKAASINVARAVLAKPSATDDTVCQIIWL